MDQLETEGQIPAGQAEELRLLEEFQNDPEVRAHSHDRPLPTHVMERHRRVLRLSEQDIYETKRLRGELDEETTT